MIFELLGLTDQGPYAAGIILIAVSGVYFILGEGRPLKTRILKSAHGVLLASALAWAGIVSRWTWFGYRGWLWYPFYVLLLLGLLSALYSLVGLTRSWPYHVVHVLTMIYGTHCWIYGALAIAHDAM